MKPTSKWSRIGAAASMAMLFVVSSAAPASADGVTDFFDNALEVFLDIRTPIATIALITIGFAFVFNMVDLRKVGWALVGIIFMFAASEILALVTG